MLIAHGKDLVEYPTLVRASCAILFEGNDDYFVLQSILEIGFPLPLVLTLVWSTCNFAGENKITLESICSFFILPD